MIHWHVIRNIQGPISIGGDPNPPPCLGLTEGYPEGATSGHYAHIYQQQWRTQSNHHEYVRSRQYFRVNRLIVTSQTVTLRPRDSTSWPSTCLYSILSWRLSGDISVASSQSLVFSRGCSTLRSCKKVNTFSKGLYHRSEYICESNYGSKICISFTSILFTVCCIMRLQNI